MKKKNKKKKKYHISREVKKIPIEKIFDLVQKQEWKTIEKHINDDDSFDVNVRDNSNNYLIQYIILYNQPSLLSLLISRGAKIDIRDNDGRGLLYYPIRFGHINCLNILLHHNNFLIGVSILEMKDNAGYTSLHYGVAFNNAPACRILVQYGANPNTPNNKGISPYHLSISKGDKKIIDILSESNIDVNNRLNNGETALHLSCNFDQLSTMESLLKKNADPNLQDYEIEFTPLMYIIYKHSKSLLTSFLKYAQKLNVNVQDSLGFTCLHHVLSFSEHDFFMIIYNYSQNSIQVNLINIYGDTYLHLLLQNYNNTNNINKILDIFLENDQSRVDIINNQGNTALIYLCHFGLWKKYKKNLIGKKLDIYHKNNKKKAAIDYIKKEDYNDFMEMVTESYINQLKIKGKENKFDYDWQKDCYVNLKENKSSSKCKSTILSHIIKDKRSYPERSAFKINIIESDKIRFGTFVGLNIDLLFGLMHLITSNQNVGSSLTHEFVHNDYLINFYKSRGINYNIDNSYLNFFISWTYDHLILPIKFEDVIQKFKKTFDEKKSIKRLFVCPISIDTKKGSHSNYLIYDALTNEVERFEPYGSYAPQKLFYNSKKFDDELEKFFKKIIPEATFIPSTFFLPKAGFQLIDINEKNKYQNIGDPGGFCVVWSNWYADMRSKNPEIPRHKLVNKTLEYMRRHEISFRNMIRNYSGKITDIRDRYLQLVGLDINMWMNDDFNSSQFDKLTGLILESL